MPDETLTQLYTGAAWPNGYSVSNLMLLMDVTDLSMANTGTDKGITVSNWLNQYFHAGSGIGLASGSNGLTITSTALGGVTSIFGRTGDVVAVSGDYSVVQMTGAAPLASPTFTGTVTLPVGLTGLIKASTGVVSTAIAGTDYLAPGSSGAGLTGVVLTAGSYSNPTWLTSISGTIVSGDIPGNAASITGSITEGQVTNLVTDLAAKAPLASPTFTGVPAGPTATVGNSSLS